MDDKLKIDAKLLEDNLVELLTNTINVSSLMERIFYSEIPDKVSLDQWVYNSSSQKLELITTEVPNLAYIKQDLESNVGKKTMVLSFDEYIAIEKDPDVLYFITGDDEEA